MSGCKTVFVCVLVQLLNTLTVDAGPIKTLVMSGKLIEGHAKFEENCNNCHQPFSETTQKTLCLKCHRDISDDLKNSNGFHGKVKIIKKRKCIHCHSDHKGRSADIIMLDQDIFDHGTTDFIIRDRHTDIDCEGCHKESAKYRDAPSECKGCHLNNDPHMGNLGERCGDCHSETGWNETDFDHGNTAFPLKGKHIKIDCSFCHPDKLFNEKFSNSCYACHVVNDIHNGSFGERCNKCHKETTWKGADFTHENVDFPLNGLHSTVKCSSCHDGKSYKNIQETSCFSCHTDDDVHNEKFGKVCNKCHNVINDWPDYRFDHDKTRMPLLDRHAKVRCDSCHGLPLNTEKIAACFNCHKKNDVHSGLYGEKCDLCHSLKNNWADPAFDHKSIGLKLKGRHKKLRCEACHKKEPEEKRRTRCFDCHNADDIHEKQEGKFCERCHSEEAWNEQLFFDHGLTAFPLIGIHAITPCEDCHLKLSYKKTPIKCHKCHNSSDTHKGLLGKDCELCHNPNGWRLWTFSHKNRNRFKLDGKHKRISCVLCHKSLPETNLTISSACVDCHSEDDRHRGKFGRRCKNCHTANSFEELIIRQ